MQVEITSVTNKINNSFINNKEEVDNEINIIRFLSNNRVHGEIIGKIASSKAYVDCNTNITDLIDEWSKLKHINSVGVIKNNKVLGIIERQDLFDIAGKPYGRDILKHKTVEKITKSTEMFNYEKSIFSIAEEISDVLKSKDDKYYLLVDNFNNFKGVFTNRDLVIYLSEITQKDILLARNLQRSIVKEENYIDSKNFSLIGASKMAKGVGGDFYYINEYNNNQWIVALCDVSGKGISAALVTTIISGMFNIFDFDNELKVLIKKLNNYILNTFDMDKFVTGIFLSLNELTGEIELFDMGHSYVYLYKKDKLYKLKTTVENRPLGLEQDIEPKSIKISLEKDEMLIMITDGILEQINSYGEEYGEERFAAVLNYNKNNNLPNIVKEIYNDINNFKGSQTTHDDMTIVIIKNKIKN